MRRLIFLVLLVAVFCPVSSFADLAMGEIKIVKKNLGDINGDRVKEILIEEWSGGGSAGDSPAIKILSGKRVVLEPISFSGGTADGYKVVGKQIVVWLGNWDEVDKFSPHRYDFTWYAWNGRNKQFQTVKTGRTKKSYSYRQAQRAMPKLAVSGDSELAIFWEETTDKGPAIETIYCRARKITQSQRDRFILTELGQLHCREREKKERLWLKYATANEKSDLSEDAKKSPKYSIYHVNIYQGWAQVSFQGGLVEPGAEVYRKNASGRWELIAEGNEFSGWIENGTIPRSVAKKIGI